MNSFFSFLGKTRSAKTASKNYRLSAGEPLEDRRLLAFDPSPMEQAYMESINRMRIDPNGELDVLFHQTLPALIARESSVQAAVNFFGVDAALLTQQWQQLEAVPPLAWSEQLSESALGHNEMMKQFDVQQHQIGDEPPLGDRVRDTGYQLRRATENIYAFAEGHIHGHAGFVVDWGDGPGGIQNPPGHRDNYMDGGVEEVGISVITDNDPSTDVGPYLVTQNFGRRRAYQSQIVGVVYEDGNSNGIYDPGEGYGNMDISITGDNGTFTTQTMTAGGYQLVVPAGTYQVTASGFPITASLAVGNVVKENQNVKVDFELNSSPRAPFAGDDVATTVEDTPVAVSVLDNDFTPGGSLVLDSLQVVSQPENGTASVNSAGTLIYTPAPDYSGTDRLEYTVANSNGLRSNVATLTIAVSAVSDPPIATDLEVEVDEGEAVTIALQDAVSDPDGDIQWNSLRVVTQPQHGIASTNATERIIRYFSNSDFFGTDVLEYRVNDQDGVASNVGRVTITINNTADRPVAVADQFTVVGPDVASLPVLANDVNPDGSADELQIEIVQGPQLGLATVVGSQVRYEPHAETRDADSFRYRVTTNGGVSETVSVSLFLVSHDRAWQNPIDAYDVNADTVVSPLDALQVINQIGVTLEYPSPAPGLQLGPPPFLDVNGDNIVAPLDALLVINELNETAPSSAASTDVAVWQLFDEEE